MHATGTVGRPGHVGDRVQAEGCGTRALATCHDHPERPSVHASCIRPERMAADGTRAIALTGAERAAQRSRPPDASPRLPVSVWCWPAKQDTPSDRCMCGSRSHARSAARKLTESMRLVGASGVSRAGSDALEVRALVPRRGGAEQLARDPHLPPQARGERSERWRLREASDAAQGHGRGARRLTSVRPTHLRRALPPRTLSSAGPRCDPASRRAHRAVSGADGLGQITCCAGRAARAAATLSPLLSSRAIRPAARQHDSTCRAHISGARGALGAAHLGSGGLCRQLHHAPAKFVTTRTRQLTVHVADRNGHVAGPQLGRFHRFLRT